MSKANILVVEDEGIVARDIAQQLVFFGYTVAAVTARGEEVLDLVQQHQPDLVLMDIQLAGALDGVQVAQILRDRNLAPVVFLTAFAADDVLARAKLSQPFGYILKPFSERELRTVLEMAVYKFKAEATIRRTTSEVQQLSRRVLQVQEEERRHLALELHDELGQALTAIKISLQIRNQYDESARSDLDAHVLTIVENTISQVRSMALQLRPSVLDDLGLVPALEWLSAQRQMATGPRVVFRLERPAGRLPVDLETSAFRIAQEALTNALRHSGATSIAITLSGDDTQLTLEVEDNGCGFDVHALESGDTAGRSMGLIGMKERATLAGGSLQVASATGKGCKVVFQCPFLPAAGGNA